MRGPRGLSRRERQLLGELEAQFAVESSAESEPASPVDSAARSAAARGVPQKALCEALPKAPREPRRPVARLPEEVVVVSVVLQGMAVLAFLLVFARAFAVWAGCAFAVGCFCAFLTCASLRRRWRRETAARRLDRQGPA